MNKFTVYYDDNTSASGDPLKHDWDYIKVTKQITKLVYLLGNSCVVMEGFKEYNHLKERLGMQRVGIPRILLMGRTDGKTAIIIFDLVQQRVYREDKEYGNEYGGQILRGWKQGKLNQPKTYFKKLKNVQ